VTLVERLKRILVGLVLVILLFVAITLVVQAVTDPAEEQVRTETS
jgi:peptidoglycan/LPS O-acetylase OafA/YrhL